MLFSLISIIILYEFSYLKSNPLETRCPNLIFKPLKIPLFFLFGLNDYFR